MTPRTLSLTNARIVWDDGDNVLVIPHYMDERTWWHFRATFEPWLTMTISPSWMDGRPRINSDLGLLRIGPDVLAMDASAFRDALGQHAHAAVVRATSEEAEDRKLVDRFLEVLTADE